MCSQLLELSFLICHILLWEGLPVPSVIADTEAWSMPSHCTDGKVRHRDVK